MMLDAEVTKNKLNKVINQLKENNLRMWQKIIQMVQWLQKVV